MAVSIHNNRRGYTSKYQVGFDLTATDASDSVGVVLLDDEQDPETVVTVLPAASGTTPTVSALYSIIDSPIVGQWVNLGSEEELDQAETIVPNLQARAFRFGGVNGKAGGHVSILSTADVHYIHSGQTKSLSPATDIMTLATGATETIFINSSHHRRLFTWEIAITAGSTRINLGEIKYHHDHSVSYDITRVSAGQAKVRVRARPLDGTTRVQSIITFN